MPTLQLKIKREIRTWDRPLVMGILNTTPDSFYENSRCQTEKSLQNRIESIIEEGADIIDIGGLSTRPGSAPVSSEEEWERVEPALEYVTKKFPSFPVSLDTYRAEIANRAITHYGVDLINDISGGNVDSSMIEVVGELKAGYIGMHMRGMPENMQQFTDYEHLLFDISSFFSQLNEDCKKAGIADFIIDPGFGFSKTLDQNYELLNKLDYFKMLGLPILVGISRKSMIYKFLETSSEQALVGTVVLNTMALLKGADIIRVHDVREAVETVKLITKTYNS